MKKVIFALSFISLINIAAGSKSNKEPGTSTHSDPPLTGERHLVYSEQRNALVFQDTTSNFGHHIIIKSLPPLTNNSTPIQIVFPKGKYTLSKSDDLDIPGDYHIYIEDLDEEKTYNLNLSEGYTIKACGEEYPGRFILHIEKPGTKLVKQ